MDRFKSGSNGHSFTRHRRSWQGLVRYNIIICKRICIIYSHSSTRHGISEYAWQRHTYIQRVFDVMFVSGIMKLMLLFHLGTERFVTIDSIRVAMTLYDFTVHQTFLTSHVHVISRL